MEGKKKRIAIVLGVIFMGIAAVLLGGHIYYRGHWYWGTKIDGLEVSGQTMDQSRLMIQEQYKDYSLQITGRQGLSLQIKAADIDYQVVAGERWEQAYSDQHDSSLIPVDVGGEYDSVLDVTYDADKLNECLEASELLQGNDEVSIEKPKSAKARFDKKKGYYVCVPESVGNQIQKEELLKTVETSLQNRAATLDISSEEITNEVYKEPSVTSSSDEIAKEIDACNKAVLRFVTWKMGGKVTEKLTPAQISKWVSYKNNKVKFDQKAIEKWTEKFCKKYQTVGVTRSFKSHTGKKVKVVGGDYGWELDYAQTLIQVEKTLEKKISAKSINAYIEDPSRENKKALTLNRSPIYLNTAYQWNQEDRTQDWDTKNYTEVSLADQMVYVFRKGKVVFKCHCITGRPVKDRITRKGTFYIKEHLPEHTMVGADYRTHVYNWVRITWTGTGFHPATWQPWSRWSKTLYQTRGSHGCVNLSVSDAKKIYDLVKYREAVFIY